MAQIIKPPTPFAHIEQPTVFLAGTIDNGTGPDWQSTVEQSLQDLDILILNPRRDEWDATWEQSIHNPQFKEQVTWELDGQEQADVILMYFAPGSKSPITLLELGLFAHTQKLFICCPPGFWRRGNIEVVASRYNLPFFDDLDTLITTLRQQLHHI
ncbi:MAG: hypothetical protein DWQ04_27890 [Chloroflexi bacterium]|nr:MAG: hypothetical protein DWQ04_27890 [Chloroflexota bacterium]